MGLLNIPGLLLLLDVACWLTLVSAAANFSIDDQDPLFRYTGAWSRIPSTMDIDGGHMVTNSSSAFALITYTFASVYFVSAKWPFKVTTNYAIDGDTPMTVDMQDHSKVVTGDDSPTVAAGVVGQWTSTVNQEHTIRITVPPGDQYAVVDMFIFEVLDASSTSPSTSTSTTGGSTDTVTITHPLILSPSFSSLTSPSSTLSTSNTSPSTSSSESQGGASSQVRTLAISMAVLGTLLFILLMFLLWWCCIRRKRVNNNPMKPRYRPVPTGNLGLTPFTGLDQQFGSDNGGRVFMTPMRENPMFPPGGNGVGVAVNHNPVFLGYGTNTPSHGGIATSGKLQRENTNYYSNISSHNARFPSASSSNQVSSSLLPSLPPTHQIPHVTHLTAPSVTNDSPPVYTLENDRTPDPSVMLIGRNFTDSVLDESERSTTAAPSSPNDNVTKKGRRYGSLASRIPSGTTRLSTGTELDDSATLTPTTDGNRERNSAWDTGYPQPLRFVPIS